VSPSGDDEDDLDLEPAGDDSGRMSFLDHLDEFRRRIINSLISIGIAFAVVIWFIYDIFDFIMRPMQQLLPAGQTLIFTDPTEMFMLLVKIGLMSALLLASPLVLAQVWLFIAPGLYSHEKRWAIPFIVMGTAFFVAGAAFSHYIVFPITWRFFISTALDYVTFMPRVEPAFAIYLRLMLACALTFQLPTVVLFLARMGMITPRFMIRNFKYAFLIIMVAAAVLSPDGGGVGMVAMGGPVVGLYIFSIGLAWAFKKKKPVEV
jgi:sec-independent protein translocase protein TatC